MRYGQDFEIRQRRRELSELCRYVVHWEARSDEVLDAAVCVDEAPRYATVSELQTAQMLQGEQFLRQFGQSQEAQIEEAGPTLGFLGDSLESDASSVEF